MKRVSKTMKSQNYAIYEHEGFIVSIHNCTNPIFYVDTGFYFGNGTPVPSAMMNKCYKSLSSAKKAFVNYINKRG